MHCKVYNTFVNYIKQIVKNSVSYFRTHSALLLRPLAPIIILHLEVKHIQLLSGIKRLHHIPF